GATRWSAAGPTFSPAINPANPTVFRRPRQQETTCYERPAHPVARNCHFAAAGGSVLGPHAPRSRPHAATQLDRFRTIARLHVRRLAFAARRWAGPRDGPRAMGRRGASFWPRRVRHRRAKRSPIATHSAIVLTHRPGHI